MHAVAAYRASLFASARRVRFENIVHEPFGSPEGLMYPVIGDAVNVAACLEELTKQFSDNPILVNAATFEGCNRVKSDIRLVDKGPQRVKGREEFVHVYAAYSATDAADISMMTESQPT